MNTKTIFATAAALFAFSGIALADGGAGNSDGASFQAGAQAIVAQSTEMPGSTRSFGYPSLTGAWTTEAGAEGTQAGHVFSMGQTKSVIEADNDRLNYGR